MKFTNLLATLALAIGVVSAEKVESIRFAIEYTIEEIPELAHTEVAQLSSGQDIHLRYKVASGEDLSIIGIGGVFTDAEGKVLVNLTSASIGPYPLSSGENKTFSQHIPLALSEGAYVLQPQLYIVIDDVIKMVPARTQPTYISNPPISWINPQFLFLFSILLVSFIGLAYAAYDIYGKRYLKGTTPVKERPANTGVPAAFKSYASGKNYDEDWLPENLKKRSKKV